MPSTAAAAPTTTATKYDGFLLFNKKNNNSDFHQLTSTMCTFFNGIRNVLFRKMRDKNLT
jgi:hypothetical protein